MSIQLVKEVIDSERSNILLKRTFILCTIAGLSGLVGYALSMGWNWSLLFAEFLIAFASFGVCFFVGNLFGMPKRNETAGSNYTLNNSLVEISEWLTKIIVGLGLVHLAKIPDMLINMAAYVKRSSGLDYAFLEVLIISTVLYFGILGVYLGYNYMRLILSGKYKEADNNVLHVVEKLEKEIKEKEVKLEEKEAEVNRFQEKVEEKANKLSIEIEGKKELINSLNRTKIARYSQEALPGYTKRMTDKAEEKVEAGRRLNPDDPNKGQWGGQHTVGFYKLGAEVEVISKTAYRIRLFIGSTDPENHPLKDQTVLFCTHPSFAGSTYKLEPLRNGIAELSLYAYGSFTVGAFVNEGVIELELDLATVPGVSEAFKNQ